MIKLEPDGEKKKKWRQSQKSSGKSGNIYFVKYYYYISERMAFNSGYAYPPPPPPVDSSRTDGQYAYGSNNIHKKVKLNSGQSSNQNYVNNDENFANYDENYVNSFYQSSSYPSYAVSYENSTYGYTDPEQSFSSQFVGTNYTGEKGYYTNSSNWGSDYVENGFGGGYQMSDKGPGGGGRGMNRGRDSGGAGSRGGGAQRGGFRDEGERRDFFKDRREEGRESWSGGSRGSSGQRTDGNRGGCKRGGGSWDGRERGGRSWGGGERGGGSRGGIERGGGSWGGGECGGGSWGEVAKVSEPRGDRGGGSKGREHRDNGGRRGRGPEFRPKSTVIKPKHPPITSEQRQRIENNNLKQLVAPKPPHKILSEMVGRSVKYEYTDNPPLPPGVVELQEMHTLLTTIDGDKSSGTGPSFDIAKNICSEHAIMTVVAKRYEAMNKTAAEGSKTKEELLIEDETPFELASIAIFKMLNEWEAKGFELPQEGFFNQHIYYRLRNFCVFILFVNLFLFQNGKLYPVIDFQNHLLKLKIKKSRFH